MKIQLKKQNWFDFSSAWRTQTLPALLLQITLLMPFEFGLDQFFFRRLFYSRLQAETRQSWLLSLSLSWLLGLFWFGVLVVFSTMLSWWGVWAPLFSFARAEEPSAWVFMMAQSDLVSLGFALLAGLGLGLISTVSIFAGLAASILVFAGLMSLPFAWLLILAERLAVWVRLYFLSADTDVRRETRVRFGFACVVILLVFVFGPLLREWLQVLTQDQLSVPNLRILDFLLGLGCLAIIETVLCLTFFHFYFQFTVETAVLQIWRYRFLRLQTGFEKGLLLDLRAQGLEKLRELKRQKSEMTVEVESKIPAAVRLRLENEIVHLESAGLRLD